MRIRQLKYAFASIERHKCLLSNVEFNMREIHAFREPSVNKKYAMANRFDAISNWIRRVLQGIFQPCFVIRSHNIAPFINGLTLTKY